MSGYIGKRKDGRWMGQIDLPPDPITGKRRRKTVYGNTKKEVVIVLNELVAKIQNGDFTEPSKITVEGYLEKWLKIYCTGKSPLTVNGYKNYIINHINPCLGNINLQKLVPAQIQEFYNKELGKYSGTTVLQIHRILHKAFSDAIKNNLLTKNPCDYVDTPKSKSFEPHIYSKEQFELLLNISKETIFELPILLAGGLGLRRGEMLGLKWKDINFKEKTITIQRTRQFIERKNIEKGTKNETSARTIVIPDVILNILEKRKRFGESYVCVDEKGNPLKVTTFNNRFKNFLEKNKLPHIRYHDLRHFNATLMLQLGIDAKIAATRLGHSTPTITQKLYQHVTKDIDISAAEKLNSVLQ